MGKFNHEVMADVKAQREAIDDTLKGIQERVQAGEYVPLEQIQKAKGVEGMPVYDLVYLYSQSKANKARQQAKQEREQPQQYNGQSVSKEDVERAYNNASVMQSPQALAEYIRLKTLYNQNKQNKPE